MAQAATTVVQQFIQDLEKVRVHRMRDGGVSLKKPLTLLLVLSRVGKGELTSNEIRFSDLETELRELIRRFGNTPSGTTNPEEPFYYLHTAPFWTVRLDPAAAGPSHRKKASATLLRKPGSHAKLDDELFRVVSESAKERRDAVEAILARWWPDGAPADLTAEIG